MRQVDLRKLRHLFALLVSADPHNAKVTVRGNRTMTPDEARAHAIEVLYAADEAEGNETLGAFGYDADDSKKLGELYSLIDSEIGWGSDDEEIDGDYAARIVQVGLVLKQKLRLVRS